MRSVLKDEARRFMHEPRNLFPEGTRQGRLRLDQ